MGIEYISEPGIRDLVESEVRANRDKGFIISETGFAQHHVDTARIAYDVAQTIRESGHTLEDVFEPEIVDMLRARGFTLPNLVNPGLVRVGGGVHDLTKTKEGDRYHEVGIAYRIWKQGNVPREEGGLGLIRGGSEAEQREVLRDMSLLCPSDAILYEELGGENFPRMAVYPELVDQFKERVNLLRSELSDSRLPLMMAEFALPGGIPKLTLNRYIALFADLTNDGGDIVSVQKRTDGVVERYLDPKGPYYNPIAAELIEHIALSRWLHVERVIKRLIE